MKTGKSTNAFTRNHFPHSEEGPMGGREILQAESTWVHSEDWGKTRSGKPLKKKLK